MDGAVDMDVDGSVDLARAVDIDVAGAMNNDVSEEIGIEGVWVMEGVVVEDIDGAGAMNMDGSEDMGVVDVEEVGKVEGMEGVVDISNMKFKF